jgi:transposase-like protein
MLVLIGATPEGKKELIGFQVGVRESAQSWRELLVEVKSRGLKTAPENPAKSISAVATVRSARSADR